ncbi:hypothetical protein BMF94_1122 [Rhodotorula taiwanensis]|uniref:PCI domain-containing protein n=1 Tax=Rhodotorula taiwanensis TaxID=741276 RepID=A0A2S5BGA9_9BASI|nr:hypothetical protein BMF94_1122 [Rhodotorula taiwanensis]
MQTIDLTGDDAPRPTPTRRVTVPASSPYDLDAIATTWDTLGRNKVTRLLHVAKLSPSLAGPALSLALSAIKATTLDTRLYEESYLVYRHFQEALAKGEVTDPQAKAWYEQHAGGVDGASFESFDKAWIEKSKHEAQAGLDRLEIELKGYLTNLIKESIRMGHRDLARFQYRVGDLQAAIRSYTKSREYGSTSQHMLEMSLGVIEVALDMSNYAFIRTYVAKAESALESAQASASNNAKKSAAPVNLPGMVAPAQDPIEAAKERERKIVQERLLVASGVAHLGSGAYDRAAYSFTDVGTEALSSGTSHFIPPADVALYATVTGLACFSRSKLRTRILENPNLRPFLDLEPYLRDIARAFYDNKFKVGLDLLEKYQASLACQSPKLPRLQARLQLDLHLSPHVDSLLSSIRQRALQSYFSPFASVSLDHMSAAFGWSADSTQAAVIDLIQRGALKARIDSAKGILVAKRVEPRVEAFRNALDQGEKMQKKAVASQLRMKLLQNEIVVKPKRAPKDQDDGRVPMLAD